MPATQRSARRPRGPGIVYSVTACVVVLALGAVALSADQAPPPTVAEFAPAALDQIEEAPDRQGTDVGEGEAGGEGSSSAAPTASPSASASATAAVAAPVIDVNRTRKCVGNPGRQTEDPQSPPCVPFFDGDNGGATAPGVTRDEIRVVLPYGNFLSSTTPADYQILASFFNTRYEFYGRKIRLLPFVARGDNFANPNPPDMIADAARVANEFKAFASLGYTDRRGAEHTYYDELARRKIIAVIGGTAAVATEEHLRARAPYQWSRSMATDTLLRNLGQLTCAQLVGKAPTYGGPFPFVPQPTVRKLGIMTTRAPDGTIPDIAPLQAALAGCGERPFSIEAPYAEDARAGLNPVIQMKDQQVTSILCICDLGSIRNSYMPSAESQGYNPEWVLSSYNGNDGDNSYAQAPPAQARRVFGVSVANKTQRNQDHPWFWAYREAGPTRTPPSGAAGYAMTGIYSVMSLVAAGIQMAGPNLTPETFAAALQRTVFPNPGAGAAPFYQSAIGFAGGTHSMVKDTAMYWYDAAQQGTVDPASPGAVCYVRRGERFGLGEWPKREPEFRQGPCR